MKLRDTVFLVIGGLLVISGMVLNTLISGDAEEQVGVKDVGFGLITCKGLYIKDGDKKKRSHMSWQDELKNINKKKGTLVSGFNKSTLSNKKKGKII